VFTGLPAGDLVMPVRLSQGAGQWPHLAHFLAEQHSWHKIDLVRVRDRKAPGGWRYYAHLLIHGRGYQSPSTIARRAEIPAGRRAGVDANVSNLSVASFPDHRPHRLVVGRVDCTPAQQKAAAGADKETRARHKALDRSRRNTNTDQYGPSVRQHKRAERRTAAGLPTRQVSNPGGARHSRGDGVPLRAYRHDTLSGRYQRTRCDHSAAARRTSQAKQARAAQVAARIVATHGNTITVEDCRISTWARLWGKRIALFSPGMLVTALDHECHATGGQFYRAGTHTTAMSQHCLCGARVAKTLKQRTTTAATAGCTVTATSCRPPWRPASNSLIPAIRAPRPSTTDLPTLYAMGWPPSKSGRVQSTGASHHHHQMVDRPGPAATTTRRRPLLNKRHLAYPRTDHASSVDVAGTAKKDSPQTVWRRMTHYGSTLRTTASDHHQLGRREHRRLQHRQRQHRRRKQRRFQLRLGKY
jgi:hypothetical protein